MVDIRLQTGAINPADIILGPPPDSVVISVDQWWLPLSQPTVRLSSVASQQSHTEPVQVQQQVVTTVDRWFAPLSSPIITRSLPQAIAAPALIWSTFTPAAATVTVASWFTPFADLVRSTQRTWLMPPPIGPPNTSKETTTVDRWYLPLSLPVPPKRWLAVVQQQAHTEPVSLAAEGTTIDRWYLQLSLPVPAKSSLFAANQQPHSEPVSLLKETVSEDRWHQPFSLPVWNKPTLQAGLQQAHTEPVSLAVETTTVDRWISPFSLPVWAKTSLPVVSQQPHTEPVSLSTETTTIDRWHQPLALPPRQSPLRTAQQQSHTEPVSLAQESVSLDRWHQPLALPPWQAPFRNASQQSYVDPNFALAAPSGSVGNSGGIGVASAVGQDITSIWWQPPLSTPLVLAKAGLSASRQQAHTEPVSLNAETTTVERWLNPFSLPVWARISLLTANQQPHTEPVSLLRETVTEDRWHQPLALPSVLSRAGLGVAQQQPHTEPVSLSAETTTLDRWYQPLALPPWQAPFRTAQQHAHTEPVSLLRETVSLDRWLVPLAIPPVLARSGLGAAQHQAYVDPNFAPSVVFGSVGNAAGIGAATAIGQDLASIRWQSPLSVPSVTAKAGLGVVNQQAHIEPVSLLRETVTEDRWHQPLSIPSAFSQKRGLGAAQQQFTSTIVLPAGLGWISLSPDFSSDFSVFGPTWAETTSLDRWYQPLALPPRQPPLRTAQQQAHTEPVSLLRETTSVDRWVAPLSLPSVMAKAGLGVAHQRAYVDPSFVPAPPSGSPGTATGLGTASAVGQDVTSVWWQPPLSVPSVLARAGLGTAYQQAHTEPVSLNRETTTQDRWFASLSLPVWPRRGLAVVNQSVHTEPVSLSAETTTVDRWHQPLSVPSVLVKTSLPPRQQQAYVAPVSIAATHSADGNASGIGSATAVGAATFASDASAPSIGTASAEGISVFAADGSATGFATASAYASTFVPAGGSAAGIGSADGNSNGLFTAVGSAHGTSAAHAVSFAIYENYHPHGPHPRDPDDVASDRRDSHPASPRSLGHGAVPRVDGSGAAARPISDKARPR